MQGVAGGAVRKGRDSRAAARRRGAVKAAAATPKRLFLGYMWQGRGRTQVGEVGQVVLQDDAAQVGPQRRHLLIPCGPLDQQDGVLRLPRGSAACGGGSSVEGVASSVGRGRSQGEAEFGRWRRESPSRAPATPKPGLHSPTRPGWSLPPPAPPTPCCCAALCPACLAVRRI